MAWRGFVAAVLAIGLSRAAIAVEFPYVAYVNSADVYVRSGPGRNYYPTDKLNKGERVEIYRHDPGGWYAIRPPRRSFSWVSARHVDLADDRLAVVNSDRTVARVGSAFSDVREVIQVRLDKGEKLELLEPPSPESVWCKVAPPAGEFRWVFAKFVESDPHTEFADQDGESRREPAIDVGASPGEVRQTSAVDADGAEGRVKIVRGEARDLSNETVRAKELNRIELELSAMVVEEITAWSFAQLRSRADAALAAAATPAERGRARELIDRLVRFDDIKQRHDALRRSTDAADGSVDGAVARSAADPRYDGVGRLAPVISQRPGAPQFALVDATNSVVSFLTPAPGVNLRPYVDKQVGVNGQRGYLTDLGRQHINVQRVTLVDVQRR